MLYQNDGHEVHVRLFDQLGSEVEKVQYLSNWNFNPYYLDMSGYSAGVYLLHVSSKSASRSVRIIKK